MKDLFGNLKESFVDMWSATLEFVKSLLILLIYIVCIPFYPLWVLKRNYCLDVWYKYHFTQYYQKCVNPKTIKRIFQTCEMYGDNSLFRENERKWAVKIIKRYRADLRQSTNKTKQ